MGLPIIIFLCIIILTATHVLDNILRRSKIKKSSFFLYMSVCFAISLTPSYNINRYISFHLIVAMIFISYIVLIGMRKKTLYKTKELTFLFFVMLIYMAEQLLGLVVSDIDWFIYVKTGAILLFCIFYIERPADSAICAAFGFWLMQLLQAIRNLCFDSYVYFDFGNVDVIQISLLSAIVTFLLTYLTCIAKERKKGKDISNDMELFTSSEKK